MNPGRLPWAGMNQAFGLKAGVLRLMPFARGGAQPIGEPFEGVTGQPIPAHQTPNIGHAVPTDAAQGLATRGPIGVQGRSDAHRVGVMLRYRLMGSRIDLAEGIHESRNRPTKLL